MPTQNNVLTVKDFYNTLPNADRKTFRENVRVLSGMEYYQFSYRLRNNTWSPLEIKTINRYIAKKGYGVVCRKSC